MERLGTSISNVAADIHSIPWSSCCPGSQPFHSPPTAEQTCGSREGLHTIKMTTTMMMEASSPLAAMQAPSYLGHCGFRNAPPTFGPFTTGSFGPNSFNFKDLSMKRSHSDYFSMAPPVRGSSPTASLAADLSQNFHIDQRYCGCSTHRP